MRIAVKCESGFAALTFLIYREGVSMSNQLWLSLNFTDDLEIS